MHMIWHRLLFSSPVSENKIEGVARRVGSSCWACWFTCSPVCVGWHWCCWGFWCCWYLCPSTCRFRTSVSFWPWRGPLWVCLWHYWLSLLVAGICCQSAVSLHLAGQWWPIVLGQRCWGPWGKWHQLPSLPGCISWGLLLSYYESSCYVLLTCYFEGGYSPPFHIPGLWHHIATKFRSLSLSWSFSEAFSIKMDYFKSLQLAKLVQGLGCVVNISCLCIVWLAEGQIYSLFWVFPLIGGWSSSHFGGMDLVRWGGVG